MLSSVTRGRKPCVGRKRRQKTPRRFLKATLLAYQAVENEKSRRRSQSQKWRETATMSLKTRERVPQRSHDPTQPAPFHPKEQAPLLPLSGPILRTNVSYNIIPSAHSPPYDCRCTTMTGVYNKSARFFYCWTHTKENANSTKQNVDMRTGCDRRKPIIAPTLTYQLTSFLGETCPQI